MGLGLEVPAAVCVWTEVEDGLGRPVGVAVGAGLTVGAGEVAAVEVSVVGLEPEPGAVGEGGSVRSVVGRVLW